MITRLLDTMYDPHVANAILMVKRLNIKISKTFIRNTFFLNLKGKANVNIKDVCEVMQKLGVNISPVRIPTARIRLATPPFMLLLEQGDDLCFSVITEISNKKIKVFDPYKNKIEELDTKGILKEDEYLALLIKEINQDFTEDSYHKNTEIEKQKAEAYKNTIIMYDNVLSAKECSDVIEYCENFKLLKKSSVDSINEEGEVWTGYAHTRTSYSADLSNYDKLDFILQKIASLLKTDIGKLERPGCLKYSPGQEFKMHHDSFEGDERKNTIILYLNDDFSGGETYFPELDHKVNPKKGSCLVFNDIDENCAIIPESLHSGLPVSEGTKYIIVSFEYRNAYADRDLTNYAPAHKAH